MSTTTPWTPWHRVVTLRDDLLDGQLAQHQFAADLYEVVMQAGKRRVYEEPGPFFALTYPTANLRALVREVALRLAGKSDKAVQRLELWYGGGKTHTLITLRHLHHAPASLPDVQSVEEFRQEIGEAPVQARVAALCCDKLDLEKGQEVRAPDGTLRTLKRPWSVLAWQLAGEPGLRFLHADGAAEERDTPPAENTVTGLLDLAQEKAPSLLILLDEVLMYARAYVAHSGKGISSIQDFLQCLTQAVSKQDRCCLVASLLSTNPEDEDPIGKKILQDLDLIVGRQAEAAVQPVTKNDAAEVLRRRFFTPESLAKPEAFKGHVIAALKGVETVDAGVKQDRQAEEDRFGRSYPFHPDLTEAFYEKWTQLNSFQRTRGVLRTFAMALREAVQWDDSPLIGPAVFLPAPDAEELPPAARELTGVATKAVSDQGATQWPTILEAELRIARREQKESLGLRHRELEKAVLATFLHSQPVGQFATSRDLLLLLGDARPDRIELEKGLQRWARASHWLDDRNLGAEGKLPDEWRLGNRPNLNQMHTMARGQVSDAVVDANLASELAKVKLLTQGAAGLDVRTHMLPESPRDVEDDGQFHFAVLGPGFVSDSGKPNPKAAAFLRQTTSSDRPRVHRNGVVLLTPSREGLELARERLRDLLAWDRVQGDLKKESGSVDAARLQTLEAKLATARKELPVALRQAWCICVTVGSDDTDQAFKLSVNDERASFVLLKNDARSRMQDEAVAAEALLPGGPYDLWQPGETQRRVSDLAGSFSQQPHLPKMLQARAILDTLATGCAEGVFVLKQRRPDRTERTFWRTRPDDTPMKDPGLELVLPEAAKLTELQANLLTPGVLPKLWPDAQADGLPLTAIFAYFAGGTVVQVDRGGWEEPAAVPAAPEEPIRAAVTEAVERGLLWLVSGPSSLQGEAVPPGVLQPASLLRPPAEPIAPASVLPANLPNAWTDGQATAQAIAAALSTDAGVTLPWKIVEAAIDGAIRSTFLETVPGSADWPCDLAKASQVTLKEAVGTATPTSGGSVHRDGASAHGAVKERATGVSLDLDETGLDDLGDAVPKLVKVGSDAGAELRFRVNVDVTGLEDEPEKAAAVSAAIREVLRDAGLEEDA